jgi:hypothetical protein
MTLWAVIFKPWADVPVYHKEDDKAAWSPLGKTVCGRGIGLGLPALPMKHVVKFGRPCKGCFQ